MNAHKFSLSSKLLQCFTALAAVQRAARVLGRLGEAGARGGWGGGWEQALQQEPQEPDQGAVWVFRADGVRVPGRRWVGRAVGQVVDGAVALGGAGQRRFVAFAVRLLFVLPQEAATLEVAPHFGLD